MVVRRYGMNVRNSKFKALSGEPTTTLAFRSSYLHSGSAVINSMGGLIFVHDGGLADEPRDESPYNFMEAVSNYLISLQSLKVDSYLKCLVRAYVMGRATAFEDSIRKVTKQSHNLRTAGEQRRPEHHTKYNGRTRKWTIATFFTFLIAER